MKLAFCGLFAAYCIFCFSPCSGQEDIKTKELVERDNNLAIMIMKKYPINIGLARLKELTNLSKLDLSYDEIKNSDLEHLEKLIS